MDTPIKTIICAWEAKATQEEQQRAHEDLQAQQGSARAAFWGVFLAGVQAVIAIGGFTIVFRSLDLSRAAVETANRAVDATHLAAEAQVRAYLSIATAHASISRYDGGKDDWLLHVELHAKNGGQTPRSPLTLSASWQASTRTGTGPVVPPDLLVTPLTSCRASL